MEKNFPLDLVKVYQKGRSWFLKAKPEEFLQSTSTIRKMDPGAMWELFQDFKLNPRRVDYLLRKYSELVTLLEKEHQGQHPTRRERELAYKLVRRLCHELRGINLTTQRLSVLGYGEITSSISLADVVYLDGSWNTNNYSCDWIYKNLPVFPDEDSVNNYKNAFYQYADQLRELGLKIPEQQLVIYGRVSSGIKVYIRQRKLPANAIGNSYLRNLELEKCITWFREIIRMMVPVFSVNLQDGEFRIALDGQISNWAILPDSSSPIWYIDTSTPLFRIQGREQLDPELFLKNTPFFLRGIIRRFFLQDVLDRYYDFRSVIVDLIANLHKEKLNHLVTPFIRIVNQMREDELQPFQMAEFTEEEIRKYYREDAFIWRFFQAARKVDKFITEKILHRRYPLRLPEKIER